MRAIHLAKLDEIRPVVVLTRGVVQPYLKRVTVAPITSTVRGLSVEVQVGAVNGLERRSVVNCDNIVTIPVAALGRRIGGLLPSQERDLAVAIVSAYDLDLDLSRRDAPNG